jgi:hypothetical protein
MRRPQCLFAVIAIGAAGVTSGCDTLLMPAAGPKAMVVRGELRGTGLPRLRDTPSRPRP